ncbi:unnamed protein product, partial [Anisakis simplex]|uniref:GAE domain-containing protein n=1 Tax=Anisakis simplex TaxID=6269 RepID=A0A0M3JK24_ANISI
PPFITVVPELFTPPPPKAPIVEQPKGSPTIEEIDLEPVELSPEQPVQPFENIVPSIQPETPRPPKPTPSQSPPPPQPPVKHVQPIIPTQSGAEVDAIPSDSDESVKSSAGDVQPAQPEPPRIDPTITAIEQKPKTAPADLGKIKPPEVDFSQDSGVVS